MGGSEGRWHSAEASVRGTGWREQVERRAIVGREVGGRGGEREGARGRLVGKLHGWRHPNGTRALRARQQGLLD
eukprot:scaffold277540_cov36-Tisochrysis_lutea.AAC.4